jgi:hypothetical protein
MTEVLRRAATKRVTELSDIAPLVANLGPLKCRT